MQQTDNILSILIPIIYILSVVAYISTGADNWISALKYSLR